MIKGIGGKPYIDLEPFLDMDGFTKLHPEICRGLALARDYAKEGTWINPGHAYKDMSYVVDWKPVQDAFKEYVALPQDHPIKIAGADIFPSNFKDYKQRNLFTRYLKAALGANDPYIYYFLWNEGDWNSRNLVKDKTEESKYFPGVVSWVENLVAQRIVSKIGRVMFFVCEPDGLQWEHRDLNGDNGLLNSNEYTPHRSEFMHLRVKTRRGFYLWDYEQRNKVFINSRAAFFNDQDWHGGERGKEQTYSLRVDCEFTDEFRKLIGVDQLAHY
jgi:hypothetical protein